MIESQREGMSLPSFIQIRPNNPQGLSNRFHRESSFSVKDICKRIFFHETTPGLPLRSRVPYFFYPRAVPDPEPVPSVVLLSKQRPPLHGPNSRKISLPYQSSPMAELVGVDSILLGHRGNRSPWSFGLFYHCSFFSCYPSTMTVDRANEFDRICKGFTNSHTISFTPITFFH